MTKQKSIRQIEEFKRAAKEVGADTSDDALDKIMRKLDLTKKPDSDSMKKGEKPKK